MLPPEEFVTKRKGAARKETEGILPRKVGNRLLLHFMHRTLFRLPASSPHRPLYHDVSTNETIKRKTRHGHLPTERYNEKIRD